MRLFKIIRWLGVVRRIQTQREASLSMLRAGAGLSFPSSEPSAQQAYHRGLLSVAPPRKLSQSTAKGLSAPTDVNLFHWTISRLKQIRFILSSEKVRPLEIFFTARIFSSIIAPMALTCVFCGNQPSQKSKEHVLPGWLLRLTGDEDRMARLGFDWRSDPPKIRRFRFNSFTFPACRECNNRFSTLEGKAGNVVHKMLRNDELSPIDIDVLLDWLDKVRVGLWLAFLYLDKTMDDVNPSFRITTRVALYDRLVGIYKLSEQRKQLAIIGPEFSSFQYGPTAMALLINNYCLLNLSSYKLCSRNLGFPFPGKSVHYNRFRGEIYLSPGKEKISAPVIPSFQSPSGTFLYQPLFAAYRAHAEHLDLFRNDYVLNHSLDWGQGKGTVFIHAGAHTAIKPYKEGMDWRPTSLHRHDGLTRRIARLVSARLLHDHEDMARNAISSEKKTLWRSVHRMRYLHRAMESISLDGRLPADYYSARTQRLFRKQSDE